jgi:hypothetical protein
MHFHLQLLQWRKQSLHTSSFSLHILYVRINVSCKWTHDLQFLMHYQFKQDNIITSASCITAQNWYKLIMQYVYVYTLMKRSYFHGTCKNIIPFHVHVRKSSLMQMVLMWLNGPTIPITYLAHSSCCSHTTLSHTVMHMLTTVKT